MYTQPRIFSARVVWREDGMLIEAVGLIVGRNTHPQNIFVAMMPYWAILEDVEKTMGESIRFPLTEGT
jgi:hypothetical protein